MQEDGHNGHRERGWIQEVLLFSVATREGFRWKVKKRRTWSVSLEDVVKLHWGMCTSLHICIVLLEFGDNSLGAAGVTVTDKMS